jgi:hypothetical protein
MSMVSPTLSLSMTCVILPAGYTLITNSTRPGVSSSVTGVYGLRVLVGWLWVGVRVAGACV